MSSRRCRWRAICPLFKRPFELRPVNLPGRRRRHVCASRRGLLLLRGRGCHRAALEGSSLPHAELRQRLGDGAPQARSDRGYLRGPSCPGGHLPPPTFVKSLALVPIRTLDPIGAIGNYWARRHRPTDLEVHVLQALADSTAVALESIRILNDLEAHVRQRTSDLELANARISQLSLVDELSVPNSPRVLPTRRTGAEGSRASALARFCPVRRC